MAYVIAEPASGQKDTACVDACPVDCIHAVITADKKGQPSPKMAASDAITRRLGPQRCVKSESAGPTGTTRSARICLRLEVIGPRARVASVLDSRTFSRGCRCRSTKVPFAHAGQRCRGFGLGSWRHCEAH